MAAASSPDYLARETGLSVYDGTRIEPVVNGLKPPLRDGQFLDYVDDLLWSFGYNDIVRFDGGELGSFPAGRGQPIAPNDGTCYMK